MNICDDNFGQTALHMACEDDSLNIVELLWDKDAGWSIISGYNLSCACMCKRSLITSKLIIL